MNTPTEQAMRAAYALRHPDYANVGQYGDALTIDTATGLPALLAERDALREALERLLDREGSTAMDVLNAQESARAALALGAKGQP